MRERWSVEDITRVVGERFDLGFPKERIDTRKEHDMD
jgi:hypothetical protein